MDTHIKNQWILLVVVRCIYCFLAGFGHVGTHFFSKNVVVTKLFRKVLVQIFYGRSDIQRKVT